MESSANGLNHIKQYEGYSSTSYNDVAGLPTIGYGHLIDIVGEAYLLNSAITTSKALQLLAEDVKEAENAVNSCVMVTLNQNEFDALVSLVYNIGAGTFSSSTVLKKINLRKSKEQISAAWKAWNKATINGKKTMVQGLVNRRTSEVELYFR